MSGAAPNIQAIQTSSSVLSQTVMLLLKLFWSRDNCEIADRFYTFPYLTDILVSHTTDMNNTDIMIKKDTSTYSDKKSLKRESSGFPKGNSDGIALERHGRCTNDYQAQYRSSGCKQSEDKD